MKKNCYIYWDGEEIHPKERKIYIQCEKCFAKNKKGVQWGSSLFYGRYEIKCNLCNTIIYKREKKRRK